MRKGLYQRVGGMGHGLWVAGPVRANSVSPL